MYLLWQNIIKECMEKTISVSLVITIYKVEKFIERCLNSAFQQNFSNLEYILVNDCTTDRSMEIANAVICKFSDKPIDVKIINHIKNQGSAVARNSGLNVASGDFVIFLDGDDYIEANMLREMYDCAMQEHADIVIADYYINYPDKQVYRKQITPSDGKKCSQWILSGKLHSSTCNKLVKRCLYVDNGIFFTDNVNMWEDMSVMPRLCFFAKKISYLPHAYLHYVQYNSESYTSNLNGKAIEDIQQVIKILDNFFKENYSESGDGFKEAMNFLKVHAKSDFIMHSRGNERKALCKLYPEANSFIGRHPSLSWFYRSSLWLSIHNSSKITDLFIVLYFFMKRLYLKVNK